jgi:Uma2 family endonuclease
MVDQTVSAPPILPSSEIVATNVSAEDYMEHYAEEHHEWVKGVVVKMAPVSLKHVVLTDYIRQVLKAYFSLNPIGTVVGEPFVMHVAATDSYREPDLQVILNSNPGELTDTAMIGPADICIEVVSPTSVTRDYGKKFEEYEKGGVREYWIIDPLREDCRFYRLDKNGIYRPFYPDDDGHYQTPNLPKLMLHVPMFWQEELPDFFAIGRAVQTMFKDEPLPK